MNELLSTWMRRRWRLDFISVPLFYVQGMFFWQVKIGYTIGHSVSLISLITAIVILCIFRWVSADTKPTMLTLHTFKTVARIHGFNRACYYDDKTLERKPPGPLVRALAHNIVVVPHCTSRTCQCDVIISEAASHTHTHENRWLMFKYGI